MTSKPHDAEYVLYFLFIMGQRTCGYIMKKKEISSSPTKQGIFPAKLRLWKKQMDMEADFFFRSFTPTEVWVSLTQDTTHPVTILQSNLRTEKIMLSDSRVKHWKPSYFRNGGGAGVLVLETLCLLISMICHKQGLSCCCSFFSSWYIFTNACCTVGLVKQQVKILVYKHW